jgi:hypothetical protein
MKFMSPQPQSTIHNPLPPFSLRKPKKIKIAGMQEEGEMVTPGEVLGKATELKVGKGAYIGSYRDTDIQYVFSSLTGLRRSLSPSPDSPDQVLLFPLLFC